MDYQWFYVLYGRIQFSFNRIAESTNYEPELETESQTRANSHAPPLNMEELSVDTHVISESRDPG